MKRDASCIDGSDSGWGCYNGILVGLRGDAAQKGGLAGSGPSGQEDVPAGVVDKS